MQSAVDQMIILLHEEREVCRNELQVLQEDLELRSRDGINWGGGWQNVTVQKPTSGWQVLFLQQVVCPNVVLPKCVPIWFFQQQTQSKCKAR